MLRTVLLTGAACAALLSTELRAQDAPVAGQATPAADTGEIIVTANRRAQSVQDIPIAVAVVGEVAIQNSGIRDVRDLTQLVPSLQVPVADNTSSVTIRIRGVGTQGPNLGLEPAVGVFIDGVYRARSGVAFQDLGELERVEVLRGPQGTLFGRNTSAGLISVVSRAPSFTAGGSGEFSFGNYGSYGGSASLTGPTIGDKVAARIFATYRNRDGTVTVNPGEADEYKGNSAEYWSIRPQLLLKPSERLTLRLIGDYSNRDEICCSGVTLIPGKAVRRVNGVVVAEVLNGDVINAIAGPGKGRFKATDDRTVAREGYADRIPDSHLTDAGVSLEANWEIGPGTLTSVTAYRNWNYTYSSDFDYSRADIAYRRSGEFNRGQVKSFTQEARYAGQTGRLKWLVGVFYGNEDIARNDELLFGQDFDEYASRLLSFGGTGVQNPNFLRTVLASLGYPASIPGIVPAGSGNRDRYRQNSENVAIFTHQIFSLTDRLDITLGGRFTHEHKEFKGRYTTVGNTGCRFFEGLYGLDVVASSPASLRAVVGNVCTNFERSALDGVDHRQKLADNIGTGIASLAYRFSDDVRGYASYSRGYKGSGFNLDRNFTDKDGSIIARDPATGKETVRGPDTSFAPETVDAFELGLKTRLFDRTLTANLDIFYEKFENFQLNTFLGSTFVVNSIKEVTTRGAELDLAWRTQLKGLTLTSAVSYTDARYGKDVGNLLANPGNASLYRIPGGRLTQAPEWSVSGSVTYEAEIGSTLKGLFYLDGHWQSVSNTGTNLDPRKEQPAYALINGRIGLGASDDRWQIEVFARNIFDKSYFNTAIDSPLQGSSPTAPIPVATSTLDAFLGEPRTFGVTLRGRF